MQESRIYQLLEEIASEIKSTEKKNRELYTLAIDVEDEALSIKIQTESFKTLRRMRGLTSAMNTFKAELEKSGILKDDGDSVYISNEHGSLEVYDFPKSQQELEGDTADALDIPKEEPEEEIVLSISEDTQEEIDADDDGPLFDPLPFYIAEEIETVSDIIGELGKSVEEINDGSAASQNADADAFSEDDDFSDLIQKIPTISEQEATPEAVEEHGTIEDDWALIPELEIPDIEPIPEIEPALSTSIEPISASPVDEIEPANVIEPIVSAPVPSPIPTPAPAPVHPTKPKPDDDFSGFGMSVPEVGIYSNRTPGGFIMFGRRVDIRDWTDMLVKVCEILILKNPYTVAQFDKYHDLNPFGNFYFSYNQGEIKDTPRKLSNGLWIETNRTPDDIVMLCKKVLELCGYPRSELEIEFVD